MSLVKIPQERNSEKKVFMEVLYWGVHAQKNYLEGKEVEERERLELKHSYSRFHGEQ